LFLVATPAARLVSPLLRRLVSSCTRVVRKSTIILS